MPNYDSYSRAEDFQGALGPWVSWDYHLRDIPLRKICVGHWEFHATDATANTGPAPADIVGSGLIGAEEGQFLGWKDPQVSPGRLNPEARISYGIERPLPTSLNAAAHGLEGNRPMARILGAGLVT